MAFKASAPSWVPIRYRFDDPAQLKHHFHESCSEHLLFLPRVPLERGANVLLELGLCGCEQSCVRRGRIVGVEGGGARGSWMTFGERVHVGALAAAAAATDQHRRKARRLPTDVAVTAVAGCSEPHLCRLVEVSATGARLTGLANLAPPGCKLALSLFGRPAPANAIGSATVVWQRGLESGVRFSPDATSRLAATRLTAEASAAWTGAIETRHDPACHCLFTGRPTDPPVPTSGARRRPGDPEPRRL